MTVVACQKKKKVTPKGGNKSNVTGTFENFRPSFPGSVTFILESPAPPDIRARSRWQAINVSRKKKRKTVQTIKKLF